MKKTGWQVDEINKLKPKAERLIWEYGSTARFDTLRYSPIIANYNNFGVCEQKNGGVSLHSWLKVNLLFYITDFYIQGSFHFINYRSDHC